MINRNKIQSIRKYLLSLSKEISQAYESVDPKIAEKEIEEILKDIRDKSFDNRISFQN